jgi:mono/diheme cytochrome c family protein
VRRPGLLLLLLIALLAGCGGDDGGNGGGDTGGGAAAEGETIFAENGCGGCHTYAPAGSSGTTGPNLDDSDVTFEQAVQQITNGGGGMPPFEGDLTQEQIDAVARFVTEGGSSAAGDGGGGSAVGPFSP